jgi:uncharacterized NAD(P)/FAD-binding protein YdhS
MSLKKEIENILNELKQKGYDRGEIEQQLNYSENYIDQQLSKGGNQRFLNALVEFNKRVLQKTIPAIEQKNPDYSAGAIFNLTESNRMMAESNRELVQMIRERFSDLEQIKSSLNSVPDSMNLLTDLILKGQEVVVQRIIEQFGALKSTALNVGGKKISQTRKHSGSH